MSSSHFIAVEGIDGSGKSSIVEFIGNVLSEHNVQHIVTREPGGTKVSEKLRNILMDNDNDVCPMAELGIILSARVQHIEEVILPSMRNGINVVTDRFNDSTFAYQGVNGIPHRVIAEVENVMCPLQPDHVILLDCPPDISMTHVALSGTHDRFDRGLQFQTDLSKVFRQRAFRGGLRTKYHIVDAASSLNMVKAEVLKVINRIFSSK